MSVAPARVAAFHALRRIAAGRADLPDELARARRHLDDPRDQSLTAEIVTGTLRWRAALDYQISAAANRPMRALDPDVLDIIRLSAYQLRHLNRVPPAAVVSDAVDLARRVGKGSAAGFVNAVLRNLSRADVSAVLPHPPATDSSAPDSRARDRQLDYLSITLSHPRWLVARWIDRYGFAGAVRWARFNNAPAPLTLRANRLRCSRDELARVLRAEGISTRPTRFAPDGLVVTEGNPLRAPLVEQRLFVVQDEGSQLVALAIPAARGMRLLDCCAAPGGKTTAVAGRISNQGLIVAADVRWRRIKVLREMVSRAGASCVRVVQADLRVLPPFAPVFDVVFIDAPCSGLGTLRRDPDLKWRRSEADQQRFTALEQQLLAAASAAVRSGGRLVYATCSSEPDENEEVVEAFLATHPDFRLVPLTTQGPPEGVPRDVIDDRGALHTWPHVHDLEAYYAVVMARE